MMPVQLIMTCCSVPGFLSSVTQTADVSDCPGKCIHAIASLICDQVLEHVSCPAKNMRCCVEAEFQKNKGEGGAPPLPLDAEDKIGIAEITERSTTTTEITTTTKRKKKRRRKTTTKATTPATTTTTTTTVTTTRKPTTQTTVGYRYARSLAIQFSHSSFRRILH